MRKRILSFLATAGLALVLAPAAFAVPPEMVDAEPIDMPEYVAPAEADPAVLDEPSAQSLTTLEGSGTEDDPILIYDVEDFVEVVNHYTDDYYGDLSFKLMDHLDLSDPAAASIRPTEWGSYMSYLSGNFDGNYKTISGIPENCFLVMAWHKGEIKNLTVEMGGNAATLVYSYFTVGGQFGETKMTNVTVTSSTPIQLESNDQANYAPFLFCTGPKFTMTDCTNYADITGPTYASVFYGYCPMPANATGDIEITNCTNHGNVTLRYAGLVFGNPTYLNSTRGISISGLENYGVIRGTQSAHYFSSDAGGSMYDNDIYFKQTEEDISEGGALEKTCQDTSCAHHGEKGGKIDGETLEGFGISVDSSTKAFKISPVEGETTVTHYVVTVSRYVNLFDDDGNREGTDRISYSEEILKDESEVLMTDEVFDLPLVDGARPVNTSIEPWHSEQNVYELWDDVTDEQIGYWLNNTATASTEDWHYYINADRTPGNVQWDVYASAYNGNQLLGTVTLAR